MFVKVISFLKFLYISQILILSGKYLLIFHDRFIIYKVPRLKNLGTSGTEFFYMDNQSPRFVYKRKPGIMDSKKNPLYKTLDPIYKEVSTIKMIRRTYYFSDFSLLH